MHINDLQNGPSKVFEWRIGDRRFIATTMNGKMLFHIQFVRHGLQRKSYKLIERWLQDMEKAMQQTPINDPSASSKYTEALSIWSEYNRNRRLSNSYQR